LQQVQEEAPASAAATLARQGILPDVLDDPAAAQALGWEEYYPKLLDVTDSIFKLASLEAPAAGELTTRAGLDEALSKLEAKAHMSLFMEDAHDNLLASLELVSSIRHRQQPDFKPLAEVHQRAQELAAQVTPDLSGKQMSALWRQAQPLLGVLDWINGPERFEQPAPDSLHAQTVQEVEAALPSAVFNALLLRKLIIADADALPASNSEGTSLAE